MKKHCCFTIADGALCLVVAAVKITYRHGVVFIYISVVIHHDLLAIGRIFALCGRIVMIRQISCDTFCPVAMLKININRIAKPLVKNFMPQRGFDDKRSMNNPATQQSKSRHGISCWENILDNGKTLIGVRC